jgi:hypothetical protein
MLMICHSLLQRREIRIRLIFGINIAVPESCFLLFLEDDVPIQRLSLITRVSHLNLLVLTKRHLILDAIEVDELLEIAVTRGLHSMIVITHEDYGCEEIVHGDLLLNLAA